MGEAYFHASKVIFAWGARDHSTWHLVVALLAGFVLYQMEHWMQTRAAPLLILSAFDTMMIGLVWREWRTPPPPAAPV